MGQRAGQRRPVVGSRHETAVSHATTLTTTHYPSLNFPRPPLLLNRPTHWLLPPRYRRTGTGIATTQLTATTGEEDRDRDQDGYSADDLFCRREDQEWDDNLLRGGWEWGWQQCTYLCKMGWGIRQLHNTDTSSQEESAPGLLGGREGGLEGGGCLQGLD